MHFQPFLKNLHSGAAILFLGALLQGCTLIRAAIVYTHSPENLPRVSAPLPIYAEKGAEPMADEILTVLQSAILHIETTHGGKLSPLPPIVICATEACYERYAALPGSAAETLNDWRITLNGEKILREKRNAVQLFTHELSHFYWFSQGIIFQPRWFEEGLAVWASNGSGAERVNVREAEIAILNGTTIHPTLNSGIWNYITETPSVPGNDWHMFYRQSGIFVHYLHDRDPAEFAQLLDALRRTKDLQPAWTIAYKESVDDVWAHFVRELKNRTKE